MILPLRLHYLCVPLDHIDATRRLDRCLESAISPVLPLSLPARTTTKSFCLSLFMATSYSTSGARETIRIKLSVLSSRVTGPKIRVPMGCLLAFSKTAALSSNLINEPSARRTPLCSHYHRIKDLSFPNASPRNRFHGDFDNVSHPGITPLGTTEHLYAHHATSAAVICNI